MSRYIFKEIQASKIIWETAAFSSYIKQENTEC